MEKGRAAIGSAAGWSDIEGRPAVDATRTRRTRDRARQDWYARQRQWRFARFLGFAELIPIPIEILRVARPMPRA